jgi:AcrR family transcriptional regulator
MSPRQYSMGARGEAAAKTRAAIVLAARQLHAERGLVATSWDDIADRAGVSKATVYRHFPSLAELVPACAQTVFDLIQPLTPEQAAGAFASMDRAADRYEHIARSSAHCYQAGADWLHAAHRERDFVPELEMAMGVIEDSLRQLVTTAASRRLTKAEHVQLFVLCDFPFWWSLNSSGLSDRATEEAMVRLVHTEVERIGLDAEPD